MWRHYKGSEFTLDSATGSVPILYPMHSDAERRRADHTDRSVRRTARQSRCAERPDTPSSGWRGNWLRWAFLVLVWSPWPGSSCASCQAEDAPLTPVSESPRRWPAVSCVAGRGLSHDRRMEKGKSVAADGSLRRGGSVFRPRRRTCAVRRDPLADATGPGGLPPRLEVRSAKEREFIPAVSCWVQCPGGDPWTGVTSGGQYWWQERSHGWSCRGEDVLARIKSLTGQARQRPPGTRSSDISTKPADGATRATRRARRSAVKLNLVSCIDTDTNTHIKATAALNRIDPAPQMVCALLRHLVATVGSGPGRTSLWAIRHRWCPTTTEHGAHGVSKRPLDREPRRGRQGNEPSFFFVPVYWSNQRRRWEERGLPTRALADADILSSTLPLLKWHTCGITLCGKESLRVVDQNTRR